MKKLILISLLFFIAVPIISQNKFPLKVYTRVGLSSLRDVSIWVEPNHSKYFFSLGYHEGNGILGNRCGSIFPYFVRQTYQRKGITTRAGINFFKDNRIRSYFMYRYETGNNFSVSEGCFAGTVHEYYRFNSEKHSFSFGAYMDKKFHPDSRFGYFWGFNGGISLDDKTITERGLGDNGPSQNVNQKELELKGVLGVDIGISFYFMK